MDRIAVSPIPDADDQVVATDALLIINWINAHPGQSEAPISSDQLPVSPTSKGIAAETSCVPALADASAVGAATATASPAAISTDLLNLLAADAALTAAKRRRSCY
jgi:hypothetical protein